MTAPPTTRRAAIAALIAAVAAACDSAASRFRRRPLVPVATLDQVPVGSAYRTTLGDQPIVVVNVRGEVRAFLAVCTHEGCPLGWNPEQHLIRCPCHGGAYDTNGRVVDGPPPLPLTRLTAVVERGRVLVAPPAPI